MSQAGETFFTIIGCMDGRCQEAVSLYGQERFAAEYPDTITEAGMVAILAKDDIDPDFVKNLKKKIDISLKNHHSRGILIFGHAECAGNPVDDMEHKVDVLASVEIVRTLVDNKEMKIIPIFVERNIDNELGDWVASEIPYHDHTDHDEPQSTSN